MELRQLRYFASAAQHLNFTAAAAECCIVQSAMSQQIAALEKELGIPLFTRTNRGLHLTPGGEALASEACRLLEQSETLKQIVLDTHSAYSGTLRIGCHGNLLRYELPKVLYQYRQQRPQVRVLLSSNMQHVLLNDLRNGRIDCMLAIMQPEYAHMEWATVQTVYSDKLYAMLPKAHLLAAKETLEEADLNNQHCIFFSGDDKKRYIRDMEARGIKPLIYCHATSHSSIETLVAAGYGISFCVASAIRPHEGIVFKQIAGQKPLSLALLRCKEKDNPNVDVLLSLFMMLKAE